MAMAAGWRLAGAAAPPAAACLPLAPRPLMVQNSERQQRMLALQQLQKVRRLNAVARHVTEPAASAASAAQQQRQLDDEAATGALAALDARGSPGGRYSIFSVTTSPAIEACSSTQSATKSSSAYLPRYTSRAYDDPISQSKFRSFTTTIRLGIVDRRQITVAFSGYRTSSARLCTID